MNIRTLALLAATCVAASACGGGSNSSYGSTPTSPPPTPSTPPAVADQVNATASITFDPASLTTKVGHTVTFAFGAVGHNVYFVATPGAPADIPGVNANTSITRTFTTAGTYTYTCRIHPSMTGSVVVQ